MSSARSKHDLKALYFKVRQNHPSVVPIDNKVIDAFQEALANPPHPPSVSYIVTTITAISWFATSPIVIIRGYKFIKTWAPQLLMQKEFLDRHVEVVAACLAVFFAVITYTFFSQFFKRFGQELRAFAFKRTDPWFLIYAATLNYCAILIALLFLNSYKPIPEYIIAVITITGLMIPVVILSFMVPFVLGVLLFGILVIRTGSAEGFSEKSNPAVIVFRLLKLLETLNDIEGFSELSVPQKQKLIAAVTDISFKIRILYKDSGPQSAATKWASKQMQSASDNFLTLNSWILSSTIYIH